MTTMRLSALIAAVALLFSLASPPRARALNEEWEIAFYVAGGVVLFLGAIMVGTILTRDESKMMLIETPPPPEEREAGVAFGLECAGPDGRPALVCW